MMISNLTKLCLRVHNVRSFCCSEVVSYRHRNIQKHNPGLNRRLKFISEDEPDFEKTNITYESIEELEENFMEGEALYDQVDNELTQMEKNKEYKTIERRHFKMPKEPNMLTWSEKEQIRFLHTSDPEKWNPVTLAASFPTTPNVIQKILRTKWKPDCAKKLKAHDQRVSDNWIAFHKGHLKVHDPNLQEHLAQFKNRRNGVKVISDQEAEKITEIIITQPESTEFISLIKNFKNENNKTLYKIADTKNESHHSEMAFLPDVSDSKTDYTLDQFRKRLENEICQLVEPPQDIKAIIKQTSKNLVNTSTSDTRYVAPSERFKEDAVVYQKSQKSPLALADRNSLPNRIQIPLNQWQRGKIYRVNDCFYDDRGYLLYRVPGLKI